MKRYRSSGFTLLEVLVALAILAISAMALSRQMGNGLQVQQQLSQKAMAAIIAENEVASILVADNWNGLTGDSKEVQLFNNSWQVQTEVSSTTEPLLKQIIVSIKNVDGQSIYELTAYKGRY